MDVAVLDSGISYTQGLNVAGRKDFASPDAEISPLYDDASGHGTSIAGIIAADKDEGELQGIAEDANLYSVRVLDENNEAPVSRVVEGIYWCISNHIDVINMSFGTAEYSTALETAVRDAEAAGIIMVAAAGNHGDSARAIDYPAAFDGVIAVGASTGDSQMAAFTSNGVGIDVLAPGEKVWSYGALQGLMAVDGTSIAAAHVTGAVAALLEKKPDMGTEFARQLLTASSVQAVGQEETGILDIGSAMEMQDSFQVQEREVFPRTDVELGEYDTSWIVSGSWGKEDHAAMVTAIMSGTNGEIVAGMARFADVYYATKLGYGQFHGQHNYVANLHFLYKAACKVDGSPNPYDLRTVADTRGLMSGISVTHTKDKTCGEADFAKMREAVVDAFTNAKTGRVLVKGLQMMLLNFGTLRVIPMKI